MDDVVTRVLRELFGLSYLFPYQRLVVSNILEAAQAAGVSGENEPAGDDGDRFSMGRQIVILPTGAGKSLCFQLPSVLLSGATLVIYPILSLMSDQARRMSERGLAPALLRGGQSPEERAALWEQVKSGKSRFIIANPEVLLTRKTLEKLPELGIVHIVIDEAHCVSEWGESFRSDYLRIGEIIDAVRRGWSGKNALPLVTAFTATASAPVLEKIDHYIFGAEGGAIRVIGNPDRNNIAYSARACLLRDAAVRDLLREHERPAIVFCSSRRGVEKLARYLICSLRDPDIRFYHAGLSREEKQAVEHWYLRHPSAVLVATCAFGMGVDKADIRTVIHRDLPPSVEAYLQESGRAGRDGLPSKAVLLWGPDDAAAVRRAAADKGGQRVLELSRYAENTAVCRRAALLNLLGYEGESPSPETECCDVCSGAATKSLREEYFIRFFKKRKRAYTLGEAAPFLSRTAGWSEDDVKEAIRALISHGFLCITKNPLFKGTVC